MKKKIVCLVMVALMIPAIAFGGLFQSACLPTDLLDSDQAILTTAGKLCGVLIVTDGNNDATVELHDDPDDTTNQHVFYMVVEGADWHGGGMFPIPVVLKHGLWLNITGTGAKCIIYYLP